MKAGDTSWLQHVLCVVFTLEVVALPVFFASAPHDVLEEMLNVLHHSGPCPAVGTGQNSFPKHTLQ